MGALTRVFQAVLCALATVTVVAATSSGSTASGATYEVPTGQAAGVSTGVITSLASAQLATYMTGIAGSGATWVRLDVDWPAVQSSPSSYNWSASDSVIKAALAAHLNVDALLTYVPQWAEMPGTNYPNPTDFGQFAGAAAQHYAPMGVHAFEIWNEPNLADTWGGISVSPASYTQVLIAGYNAIKAVDPGSVVISGGLSPATDEANGSEMSPGTFLIDMYVDGAAGYMDAVGIHPYFYPGDPLTPVAWNTFYDMPIFYEIMAAFGDASKKIWVTEFGVPTCNNTSVCVSQATQASQLTEVFSQIKQWSWVGPFFYYNWQDGTDTTQPVENFGLLNSSGNAKPALESFDNGAALLNSGPVPANTTPPIISGTAQQGTQLKATTGSWSGSPTSYSYQWKSCTSTGCSPVSGATTSSYVLRTADLGHTVVVVVTASNSIGSASATSKPTQAVTATRRAVI
jgi:hypothetical protein